MPTLVGITMRGSARYVNSCWPTVVGMRRSSVETKAVILAAARQRFAESGFERATIRAIAADANIALFFNKHEVKYLVKPFAISVLIDCVKTLLR